MLIAYSDYRKKSVKITVFTGSARPQAEQYSQDADGSCTINKIPDDDHLGYVVPRDFVAE